MSEIQTEFESYLIDCISLHNNQDKFNIALQMFAIELLHPFKKMRFLAENLLIKIYKIILYSYAGWILGFLPTKAIFGNDLITDHNPHILCLTG